MTEVAEFQLFVDYWRLDAAFRDSLRTSVEDALQSAQLDLPVTAAEPFVSAPDDVCAVTHCAEESPLGRAWLARLGSRMQWRDDLKSAANCVRDPDLSLWRKRELRRLSVQFGPGYTSQLVQSLYAIELSDGCSGGCRFCGFAAKPLSRVARWAEKREVFGDVVSHLESLAGSTAMTCGFLYHATDPLDNPDYERFVASLYATAGFVPQMTTALADRDPERTRGLLTWASSRDPRCIHRFSIRSTAQLERVRHRFSSSELASVEIVPMGPHSLVPKTSSGRALRDDLPGQSIACVSGFIVNLVTESVELVTPWPASPRCPDGMRHLGRWQLGEWLNLHCFKDMASFGPPRVHCTTRLVEGVTANVDCGRIEVCGGGRLALKTQDALEATAEILNSDFSVTEFVRQRKAAGASERDSVNVISQLYLSGLLEPSEALTSMS